MEHAETIRHHLVITGSVSGRDIWLIGVRYGTFSFPVIATKYLTFLVGVRDLRPVPPESSALSLEPELMSCRRAQNGQAMTRSGTITVPFVSGDTSNAQAKLSAPKHVPTIIGMAKPKSY